MLELSNSTKPLKLEASSISLSEKPKDSTVFDFKIPFYVGYCEVSIIDGDEMKEYEDYTSYYDYDEDDDGEIEITIRDGNHRTFGALASGNDAYVIISDNQYQDYENWIKAGKPDNMLYEWLEDNLI